MTRYNRLADAHVNQIMSILRKNQPGIERRHHQNRKLMNILPRNLRKDTAKANAIVTRKTP